MKTISFTGYASIFNTTDYNNDIIISGAFKSNLTNDIKLLWQHDTKFPIGIITSIIEDSKGLFVSGDIILDVKKGLEAYSLLNHKIINGLSIGYKVMDSFMDEILGIRYLKQLLLLEVSIVTIPANPEARIHKIIPKMVGDSGIEPLTSTMST